MSYGLLPVCIGDVEARRTEEAEVLSRPAYCDHRPEFPECAAQALFVSAHEEAQWTRFSHLFLFKRAKQQHGRIVGTVAEKSAPVNGSQAPAPLAQLDTSICDASQTEEAGNRQQRSRTREKKTPHRTTRGRLLQQKRQVIESTVAIA
jgi:hypothetical protein